MPAVREHEGAVLEAPAATSEAPTSLLHKGRCRHCVDTLGIEPRAFRMQSGCDTTTPCAHMRVKSRCVRRHRNSAVRRWSHRQDNNLHCGLLPQDVTLVASRQALPSKSNLLSALYGLHGCHGAVQPGLLRIPHVAGATDGLAEITHTLVHTRLPDHRARALNACMFTMRAVSTPRWRLLFAGERGQSRSVARLRFHACKSTALNVHLTKRTGLLPSAWLQFGAEHGWRMWQQHAAVASMLGTTAQMSPD